MPYSLSRLGYAVRFHTDTTFTTKTSLYDIRTKVGESGTISMGDFKGTVSTTLSGVGNPSIDDYPIYTISFSNTGTHFHYIRDTVGNIGTWNSLDWSVIRPSTGTGNTYSYKYRVMASGTTTIYVTFFDRYNATSSITVSKIITVNEQQSQV